MTLCKLMHVTGLAVSMGLLFSGCSKQKSTPKRIQVGQGFFNPPTLEEIRGFSASSSDTKSMENYAGAEPQIMPIDTHEFQAKLIDIPIPFGARLIGEVYDSTCNALRLTYHCNATPEAITLLYKNEMERSGWHLFAQCAGKESLLIFNKPSKFCTCLLRPILSQKNTAKGVLELVIITGSKN